MQTISHSFIESLTNITVGYGLAIWTQYLIYPALGIYVTYQKHFIIAGMFTLVSLCRSFILRRIFNLWTMKQYDAKKLG